MSREYLPYFVHVFELDDEPVTAHIKRMSYEEFQAFSARSTALEKTVLEERVFREPEGPEQARKDDGTYAISWEEICQRRLREMSSEERADIELEQTKRLKEQDDFLRDCIERYIIHVEPGLVDVHADGTKHAVVDGKGLIAITGGRRNLHLLLYQAIFSENHLDERQKKALRSLPGSSTSSKEPRKGRRGRKRKTTAANAGTAGSAGNAAASHRSPNRSGSEHQSSGSVPEAAPSSH